jgi:hypothetical protein
MSKRQFDGYVKAWRRALHRWDAPDAGEAVATFALGMQTEAAPKQGDPAVVQAGATPKRYDA